MDYCNIIYADFEEVQEVRSDARSCIGDRGSYMQCHYQADNSKNASVLD